MSIVDGSLGSVVETTYGVRVRASPLANTVTYAFGEHYEPFPLPIEKPVIIPRRKFSSFDPGSLLYGKKEVAFEVNYQLIEGAELYYPLNKVSDTGPISGIYTHTITGMEPSDGATLTSRTLHLATDGLTSDKILDVCGSVVERQDIGGKATTPGVYVSDKFRAQRITDENGTHDLDGGVDATQAAAAYTNPPVFRDTNLTEADLFRVTEVTINTVNIFDAVRSWNIAVENDLKVAYANRNAKTDNYNKSQNTYPSSVFLQGRKYEVLLTVVPTDDTIALFDKLKQSDMNTDLTLKLERTTLTTSLAHSIEWTFDVTTCPVIDITGSIGYLLEQEATWGFLLQPKTLVSLESLDEQASYD